MRPRPDRIEALPKQYFTSLLARVAAVAAEPGEPLIDLGRGNPDVPPPAHVVEALAESAREQTSAVHGYAPFAGLPELREAIATGMRRSTASSSTRTGRSPSSRARRPR